MTKSVLLSILLILAIAVSLAAVFSHSALATHDGAHGESQGSGTETTGDGTETPKPKTYLENLYLWFLGFVGIAALFAIVYGGVLYMFSGASITQAGEARKWIQNAVIGILLAAASFLILYTINPDLVQGFDINAVINSACQKTKAC